eukprot:TRINITY_DN7655_c0_g1_i1.p1 TRINITY_DN7655_c0_g1~~TRINITY_DN7655_c0_g1_i1.p1  ORF type:complete len:137 (-),score=11.31 TRINITY_DN7655_c0_g1_i1:34-444(-)
MHTAVSSKHDGQFSVLLSSMGYSSKPEDISFALAGSTNAESTSWAIGDCNSDGFLDLIQGTDNSTGSFTSMDPPRINMRSPVNNSLTLFRRNLSTGEFSEFILHANPDRGFISIAFGDVNLDGILDLFTLEYSLTS